MSLTQSYSFPLKGLSLELLLLAIHFCLEKQKTTMKLHKKMKTILPLAAFAGLAVSVNAAVIIPDSATASSQFNGTSADASNLLGDGFTALDPIETSTHANGSWGGGEHWFGSGSPTVDFDLGGTYTVGEAHVWNWNASNDTNWGVKDFTLVFSTDGLFDGGEASQSFTNIGQGTGLADYTGEHFTLTPVAGVTHIRLQVDTPTGGSFTGLSEVRFSEAVPEPTTTALLGLGGLALILRRRK